MRWTKRVFWGYRKEMIARVLKEKGKTNEMNENIKIFVQYIWKDWLSLVYIEWIGKMARKNGEEKIFLTPHIHRLASNNPLQSIAYNSIWGFDVVIPAK